jgi:RsiW-degrading membrane proteinase PrsW (M82 family)
MSTLPASTTSAKAPPNWSAIIQLILSALAALSLLAVGVIIALTNLLGSLSSGSGVSGLTQPFMVAASLIFLGILVLPSAWYSWKEISHPEFQPVTRSEWRYLTLSLTIFVLALEGGVLALGNLVAQNDRISWFLLPPLNVLATGLPVLWLVYIGTRGLIPGSPKRKWGVLAVGLTLGPFLILVLELLLLISLGILILLWLVIDPNLSNQLTNLAFRLEYAAPNVDQVLKILLPYLLNPGLLFISFAFISVLIPIIEETLKPLGVWFLARQKITPAQGFTYGILSGAGFGLFENLGNTSGGGTDWALVAASRMSTLLLHCFTAGLVGWALASAWSQRRYIRLGISFTIAILIHGLWNGMAVLSSLGSLQNISNVSIPRSLQQAGTYTTVVLIVIGVLVLIAFIGFNRFLRRDLAGFSPSSTSKISFSSTNAGTPTSGADHETSPLNSPIVQVIGETPSKTQNDFQRQEKGENFTNDTGK